MGFIGAVVGVLGTILVAYLFSSRSRLATQINSLELVGRNSALPAGIEFFFKGAKVPKVTLSRIAIWNFGNTTLRGDQIVESDPLRIVTSEGSAILEATTLKCTRSVNDFLVFPRQGIQNEVVCKFDFLDPRDGASIEIIHTGSDKLEVMGTLRGVPKKIKVIGVPKQEEKTKSQSGGSPFVMRVLGLVVTMGGLSFVLMSLLRPQVEPNNRPLVIGMGLLFGMLGFTLIWLARLMPPAQLSTQITTIEPKKPFWRLRKWTVFAHTTESCILFRTPFHP